MMAPRRHGKVLKPLAFLALAHTIFQLRDLSRGFVLPSRGPEIWRGDVQLRWSMQYRIQGEQVVPRQRPATPPSPPATPPPLVKVKQVSRDEQSLKEFLLGDRVSLISRIAAAEVERAGGGSKNSGWIFEDLSRFPAEVRAIIAKVINEYQKLLQRASSKIAVLQRYAEEVEYERDEARYELDVVKKKAEEDRQLLLQSSNLLSMQQEEIEKSCYAQNEAKKLLFDLYEQLQLSREEAREALEAKEAMEVELELHRTLLLQCGDIMRRQQEEVQRGSEIQRAASRAIDLLNQQLEDERRQHDDERRKET